ncbi:MAG: preprotein translocase subunit SecE [Spirochaetes bacterium GWF1_31_7]|nr:MAG: preprotein translocase subunit SecE [Spirochaetes bacterium GWE1_32_154]OHD47332.1 MAG: preprotein translocase subunit SecE [Spirochaetes bacterium GWE2_31_10]OHD53189.1 MAG: preprotein translocase subunit SecE [Spirochaetes bacterium GWF1_31_7]OHD78372.1 MAG: preprotein translocase subunit SecE [Spirochaetes bacterium RIFOXYB1_FULL_32_8]HBD95000.1 preprotein translocase subunit SecE [Spirochaetia bacterium]
MKIFNFFEESYLELKKVNWPTRDEVISQTVVVVVSLVVLSIALAVVDFGSLQLITKIITF